MSIHVYAKIEFCIFLEKKYALHMQSLKFGPFIHHEQLHVQKIIDFFCIFMKIPKIKGEKYMGIDLS